MTPGSPRERFVALDSLRGVAACLVVLYHCPDVGLIAASPFVLNAWLFVEFFFVLSGFVIASAYFDKLRQGYSIPRFMLLRLGRLFPLHALVLSLFLAFHALVALMSGGEVRPAGGEDGLDLLRTLFFLQIFADPPVSDWNGPSWSVAAEFWVYGVAALGIAWLKRRVFLMLPAVIVLALWLLLPLTVGTYDFAPGIAVVRCGLGFALGMLCWKLTGERRSPARRAHRQWWTLIELAALAGICAGITVWGGDTRAFLLPFLFAASIPVFATERGALSQLLRGRFFAWLGELSYAVYIGHMLVLMGGMAALKAIEAKFGLAIAGDLQTIVLLAGAILFAALIHRWVEWPARQWSRRIVDRSAARAEAIAPTF